MTLCCSSLYVCGYKVVQAKCLHAPLFVRICKPGWGNFELQISVEGATEDIFLWKQKQWPLPTASKINHIVIMKTTAVIAVCCDYNEMTETLIIILVQLPPPQISFGSTDLTSCICDWLRLTTVAMGEMEKLRKEAESLKDQITVSMKLCDKIKVKHFNKQFSVIGLMLKLNVCYT